MFKVISAEIKKILSKPSIYVLAIILAAILVLGVFIYKPTETEQAPNITLIGSTFTDKYNDFIYLDGGIKSTTNKDIDNMISLINNYTETVNGEKISKKEYIQKLYNNVLITYSAYRDCANNSSSTTWLLQQKNNLDSDISILHNAIITNIASAANGSYAMLSTSSNYENYTEVMREITAWVDVTVTKEDLAEHCSFFEKNLKPALENCLALFIYPTLPKTFINQYTINEENSNLNIIKTRLNDIESQIEEDKTIASAKEEINLQIVDKMDEYANLYKQTADVYLNMVKYNLLANAFEHTTTTQELELMHISNYSSYNINSLKVKYEFLFENNKLESSYAIPLTIGTTSNAEINAYDYSYFILKLFSFVIIAYAIMLACYTIAGEIKEGSMRYFAIRPVSRTELYFGKLLAILLLSTILIIFSSIISFLVGGTVYGFGSSNILTIFNGTTPIVIPPIVMLIVLLFSLVIEVAVYTSIALLLSTIIKSDLFSVTIVLLIYLVNTLLPMFIQGANTWLGFYPFSHISLYPLFGSAVYANPNFFNLVFGAKVYATTNIGLTITIVLLTIAGLNFIAAKIFNNKEL